MVALKKNYLMLVVFVVISVMMSSMVSYAEMKTIEGKITGLNCVLFNYTCPIDKADPMLSIEKEFVLVTADGEYYLMPNIGLGLKARYALEVVEVVGDVNPRYKAIMVKKLIVKGKVVWTPELEEEMSKKIRPFMP